MTPAACAAISRGSGRAATLDTASIACASGDSFAARAATRRTIAAGVSRFGETSGRSWPACAARELARRQIARARRKLAEHERIARARFDDRLGARGGEDVARRAARAVVDRLELRDQRARIGLRQRRHDELADLAAAIAVRGRAMQPRHDAEVVLGPMREHDQRARRAEIREPPRRTRRCRRPPSARRRRRARRAVSSASVDEQPAQRIECAPARLLRIRRRWHALRDLGEAARSAAAPGTAARARRDQRGASASSSGIGCGRRARVVSMSTTPSSILNGTASRSKQRPSSTVAVSPSPRRNARAACSCRGPSAPRSQHRDAARSSVHRPRARASASASSCRCGRRADGRADACAAAQVPRRLADGVDAERVAGSRARPAAPLGSRCEPSSSASAREVRGRRVADQLLRDASGSRSACGASRSRPRPRTAAAPTAPRRASRRPSTSRSPASADDPRLAPATCRPACRPRRAPGGSSASASSRPKSRSATRPATRSVRRARSSGLRSRCSLPAACSATSASASWISAPRRRSTSSVRLGDAVRASAGLRRRR